MKNELIRFALGVVYITAVFLLYHYAPFWVTVVFIALVGVGIIWVTRKR